uniref:Ribonuclease III n=1 Tax=Pithovirus LCPAC202 TaxID=2506592 RepID=A0A481Z5L7_9VIRU|nr:MAG: ribonuclease III [Pithovirus LCPAC202]
MSSDDQTRFLDGYFGIRNGKKLVPQDGLNYTKETLSYMVSSARANEISKLVSAFMKDKSVHLMDICAGIGGFTMAFLDNSQIEKVISYELDSERQNILKRNLKAYDFNPDRFQVLGRFDGLDSEDIPDLFGKDIENLVVFFDPPWLPDHIQGHESSPDEYLLEGITIGDKTLEGCLAALSKITQCKLVIFRVPPNYKFGKVDKWHCQGQPVKNSLYYICVPSLAAEAKENKEKNKKLNLDENQKDKNLTNKNKSEEKPSSNQKEVINDSQDKKDKMFKPDTTPQNSTPRPVIITSGQPSRRSLPTIIRGQPTSIRSSRTLPTIVRSQPTSSQTSQPSPTIVRSQPPSTLRQGTAFVPGAARRPTRELIQGKRGLPRISNRYGPEIITLKSGLVRTEREVVWINNLLKFLYNEILHHAIPDPAMRSKLVSANAARVWIPAFTHVSYNPNDGENYEVLEKLGDSIMKTNFTWYMIRHIKNITEGQLGRLSDYYLSKEFQANLSNKYGFSNHVLINLDLSIHVKEDVLEAFFGALFMVAELYLPTFHIGISPTTQIRNPPSSVKVTPACDVCYKFLSSVFERGDIQIDYSLFLGPATNQVKEIFEKMGWGSGKNIIEEIEKEERLLNGGFTITLTLTDRFLMWAGKYNQQYPQDKLIIRQREFAKVTAPTLKVARAKAYEAGLQYLATLHITLDWADRVKAQSPTSDPLLAPYYPQAKAEAIKNGMVNIIFSKGKEGSKAIFTQLLGVDKNGRKYVLVTINGTPRSRGEKKPSKSILKQAALVSYIKRGQTQNAIHYTDVWSS